MFALSRQFMSPMGCSVRRQVGQRQFSMFTVSPLTALRQNVPTPTTTSTPSVLPSPTWSSTSSVQIQSVLPLFGGIMQRRWSRGNTYQPSTLKRKRKFGFLARMRSRTGRKIVARRKHKGRWFLTH